LCFVFKMLFTISLTKMKVRILSIFFDSVVPFWEHQSQGDQNGFDVQVQGPQGKIAKKLAFLTHNKGKLYKNFDRNIGFWENVIFSPKIGKNRGKLWS
jgi:hypothetical protein